jgi:hypothetical protein
MSDNAPVDQRAIEELETLVHHLADELTAFRRRALLAEARVKEIEGHDGGAVSLELASRVGQLERENARLQAKLDAAGVKAKHMLDRVRFLRQQTQGGGER